MEAHDLLHSTDVFCGVGEQGHETCFLDSGAQATLMLGARPCLAAGLNLAAIRDIALHEAIGILVINFAHVIMAKLTDFATRYALTT